MLCRLERADVRPHRRLNTALEGRYRIACKLVAAGWRRFISRTTWHERQVALKVLKPELAAERFLAEIKTTANLQHPHIRPLDDSGEAGGSFAA